MFDAKTANNLLEYNQHTGVFTRRVRTANAIQIGDIAGHVNLLGYTQISIFGKNYLAHRLAWLCHYGMWPSSNIDHIDGNRSNNSIKNLRLCNQSQNIANSKRSSNNTSGYKGVSYMPGRNKWRARITVNYKETTIGYFDTKEAAHAAYVLAANKSFKEFHSKG